MAASPIASGIGLHDGDVRVADFDADSRDDVFVYEASTGRWTLMLSIAEGPTFERGNWGAGWDVTIAHLNADRQADLFLWDGASGAWSGCIRDKSASFACSSGRWPAGGRVQPLDRDGDGRDELLRYDARTGSWTLIGVGPGRVNQAEGVWEPGWSVASGDLDGDGRDDLALYNPETGELIQRLSRGSTWQDERSEAVAGPWAHGRPSTLTILETSTTERATSFRTRISASMSCSKSNSAAIWPAPSRRRACVSGSFRHAMMASASPPGVGGLPGAK